MEEDKREGWKIGESESGDCLNHGLHGLRGLHGEERLLSVGFSFYARTTNQRYECLRAFPAVRNRTYQGLGKIGDRNPRLQKRKMRGKEGRRESHSTEKED